MTGSIEDNRVVAHFRPFKALVFSAIVVAFSVFIVVYVTMAILDGRIYKSPRDPILATMLLILAPIILRDYLRIGLSVVKNGTRAIYVQSGRMIYLDPAFFGESLDDVVPVSRQTGMRVNVITLDNGKGKRRYVPLNLLVESPDLVVSTFNACLGGASRF